MVNTLVPTLYTWYQDLSDGHLFEVVAVDDDLGLVECQHADGEIGEYDMMHWRELRLAPATAPEDWRLCYEMDDEEDEEGYAASEVLAPYWLDNAGFRDTDFSGEQDPYGFEG